jgi:hypothetical protein
MLLELRESVEIANPFRNLAGIEEAHAGHVLHHQGVRLRQQGDVERSAFFFRVMEANLISEDRLADAGTPLDDIDARFEDAAVQDSVETV